MAELPDYYPPRLQGQVAVVTGAARGLGRAYALRLAKLGADIVVNDIKLDAAADVQEQLTADTVMDEIRQLGRRAIGIEADVASEDAVHRPGRALPDDPHEGEHERGRDDDPEERRQERGNGHLLDQPAPLHDVQPARGDRRAAARATSACRADSSPASCRTSASVLRA